MKNAIACAMLSLAALCGANVVAAAADTEQSSSDASSRLIPGLRVTARFTPNAIVSGQSTTFSWSARGGASFCEITGVPGLDFGGPSGSLVLTPTSDLQAYVFCEGPEDGQVGSASATLTVQSANTPPVVNTSFSPTSIYTGQSSTFSWSSQYATSCSSTGAVSVGSTAGSQSVSPASSTSVTVTCTGPGGSTSSTADLTVSPAPPAPPYVWGYANPSWLNSPGWAWIHWQSTNASYCNYGGPFGAIYNYFSFSSPVWITCYGPGGSASTVVWVTVSGFGANSATDGGSKAAAADVRHLGLDLTDRSLQHVAFEINGDGLTDLLVVDTTAREAYVVLNQNGRYVLARTISNVGRLQDIRGIRVPSAKGHLIEVDVSQ
ncbi:MAG: hypothetical protein JNN30_06915 [Rhodanobacteraceae bacterium]|nr:hypothetical protein [Rhodanobacteraceae bacterium]